MKIEIHHVEQKGRLKGERLWLQVNENVPDLSAYQVADTTYFSNGAVSNELRHTYWFERRPVKSGDWICLITKGGKDSASTDTNGSTTHFFHWWLRRTVWNKGKDQALLFEIGAWARKGV